MGKWSFSSVKFSDAYREHEAVVKAMTVEQLADEWKSIGEPTIYEYGLNIWSGISGDGWATIDNSGDPGYKDNPLQLFVKREDFKSGDPKCMEPWYKRATIMAHRLGLRKRIAL